MNEEYLLSDDWKHKVSYKPYEYDFIEDFIYFITIYPSIALALNIYIKSFIFLAAMLLMTINRRKSGKIIIYVLCQMAIFILVFLSALGILEKVIFAFFAFISCAISFSKFKKRLSPDTNKVNTFVGNVTVYVSSIYIYITYLIALGMKNKYIIYTCFICFTTLLICFTIYKSKSCTYGILKCDDDYSEKSFKKALKTNSIFVICISVIIAVAGFAAYKIVYIAGLDRIDEFIIGIITNTKMDMPAPKSSLKSQNIDTMYKGLPDIFSKSHSKTYISGFFSKVMEFVFYIFVIFLLVRFIFIPLIKFMRNIIRKAGQSVDEEVQSIFSFDDAKKDVVESVRSISKKMNFFWGSSNNQKIRKIYYNTIRKYRINNIKFNTPFEINREVLKKTSRNIDDLTKIYEKARYGKSECLDDEVKKIK